MSPIMCCICCEAFTSICNIIIVKHENDASLDISRKRAHYFHRNCIIPWRREHGDCPLDRDPIDRIYTVPGFHITGLNLECYNHDYYNLITRIRVNDQLLDHLDNIDDPDKNNKTLAFYTCIIGNYNLVTKLLGRSADFNRACGDHGFTPLMAAVCYNHYSIVAKILSKINGVSSYDTTGTTAFGYACKYRHSRIIGEFLDRRLVTDTEVRSYLDHCRSQYMEDKLYGEEIIERMHHYLRIIK